MFNDYISSISLLDDSKSYAINAENPYGRKGSACTAASELGVGRKGSPCINEIASGETVTLAEIDGPGTIEHIWMTVTEKTSDINPFVLRDLVLRIYWDGQDNPSVECPLGDFFCCGFGRYYPVNSFPITVNPLRGFNCYFPMPFIKKCIITLENQNEETVPGFFYQIDYSKQKSLPKNIGYFHAQWRRQSITEKGNDYVILDNVHGKGKYIGTFLALTTLERYWWGEGEVKFYIDGDSEYPSICSTGTEDYFGGAWSFAKHEGGNTIETNFCTPFAGYPYFNRDDFAVHNDYHMNDCPAMRGLYRFHLPDPIRFEENIRVTMQQIGSWHRGLFERQDDVATTAYWYQTLPTVQFPPFPERMQRWPR